MEIYYSVFYELLTSTTVDIIPVCSIAGKVEMAPQLDQLNLSSSTPINNYRLFTRHYSIKHSLVRTAIKYAEDKKKNDGTKALPPITYASPQDVILFWREREDRGENGYAPIDDSDAEELECEGSDEEEISEMNVDQSGYVNIWQ